MSNDKIHQKVADVLGMELSDENDDEDFDPDNPMENGFGPIPEANAVVAVPDTVNEIDNPELPALHDEMVRIEHGQRQTEILLNRGIATVEQALGEIALMPPVYKARAMEAAAELFKAVGDLSKFKIEVQIKLADMRMKQQAFTRNKPGAAPSTLGSGNTFVFNREDVMRVINQKMTPAEPGDDDEDES